MSIEELNKLSREKAFEELFKCCSCTIWAQNLTDFRPFKNREELLRISDMNWISCEIEEGLEAFSHHSETGDLINLEKKFASSLECVTGEQSGVDEATHKTLIELAEGNASYEKKFGFVFIDCTTGKTADEMLEILKRRMANDIDAEFKIAMNEQNKITHILLNKLIE